jgi:DNA-binding beta-propeller fold protein YncE
MNTKKYIARATRSVLSTLSTVALSCGVNGAGGLPGALGNSGESGARGSQGADGGNGAPGAEGRQGATGSPGAKGDEGTNGIDGTDAGNGIFVTPLARHSTGLFDEGAAEIVEYDPATKRAFVTNAGDVTVDVLDLADPSQPSLVETIDVTQADTNRALETANSVAVANGVAAVAIADAGASTNGIVAFYDTADLSLLGTVEVGVGPDMVTFTPDGSKLLVANEAEPSDDMTVDAEGSVSVADVSSGFASASAVTAGFSAFEADIDALRASGVRIYSPGASVAQDLEPEFVAVSDDGKTAWVSLQEANAIATLDVDAATITEIRSLGLKDHSIPGNELDASNKDGGVRIATWPVVGMYMPDALAAYTAAGRAYLVTANEGDSRDYGGFSEEERVADLVLDPDAYPDAATLQLPENLGRLKTTTATGDSDGDGDIDLIHAYGARSFSIWEAESGALVFDSGNQFEVLTANRLGEDFNASNDENGGDSRSDDKRPEPEEIELGRIGGHTYAFIGLERVGGIMVYDITHPESARFIQYVNTRDFSVDFDGSDLGKLPEVGDLGPESIEFVPAGESGNGKPLLIVGNEVSGTTALYEVVLL